ncbi:hypothetical protein DVS77_04870 [Mycolicibacterium moriokaense]|nr:hypothetical protein DVS77_04870 [Mycolicibacterium moriokaense]
MSPTTVANVLARMQTIAADALPGDGAAVFNDVYLQVTKMVADRLHTPGIYHDAAFIADLDVRFAGYWFDAYDAVAEKPKAWAPLFAVRGSAGILPIQFALAGMNAHIENDLPIAVVATCAADGRTPTSRAVREDYGKINELLADVEAKIRRSFLNEVERAVDDSLEPVAHLITSWDIAKARDFAWLNVETLWQLRRTRRLYDAYAATLSRTVGMGSRLLLTPVAHL